MPVYQSYPPSLWETPTPPPTPSTGAVAGTPGAWVPGGSTPPASVAALQAASPAVSATPTTAWGVGTYVQTGTAGASGEAHWDGAAWVSGRAPAEEAPEE